MKAEHNASSMPHKLAGPLLQPVERELTTHGVYFFYEVQFLLSLFRAT